MRCNQLQRTGNGRSIAPYLRRQPRQPNRRNRATLNLPSMKPGLARTLLSHLPLLPQRLLAPGDEPAKAGAKSAEAVPIEKIEWREFEQLVTESFRRRGYHTPDTARPADAGGDQILRRDRETYLLHCKYWRHAKVDVGALQALHKAMLARNVSGAWLARSAASSSARFCSAATSSTISLSRPSASASCASTSRAVKMMSLTRAGPSSAASRP
jgi:hypothetical protein